VAAGYARCNAELVAALTYALGGPNAKDYADAVRIHIAEVSRRQARAAADAPGWRPGDFRGRDSTAREAA
jgi:hypothetical protein